MSIPRSTRAVVATATIAVLSACSGGSQFSPAGTAQSLPQQAVAPQIPSLGALAEEAKSKKPVPLIFAADEGSRTQAGGVYAYEDTGSNQAPIWSLTGAPLKYPDGLWVDGSTNLYVADVTGFVFEYNAPTASGAPKLSFTYDDLGYQPNHIATCGSYLYASNLESPSNGGAAITVWKIGNKTPVSFITNQYYAQGVGEGMTCDNKTGEAYFGYNASYAGPGEVDQYAAGVTGNAKTLKISPSFLAGLTFNKSYATVVLGDAYNPKGPAIEFWTLAGKLKHSIFASWIVSPNGFAYESTDKYLWDADNGNNALHQFTPAKGVLTNTITNIGGGKTFGLAADVAVSPPDHT